MKDSSARATHNIKVRGELSYSFHIYNAVLYNSKYEMVLVLNYGKNHQILIHLTQSYELESLCINLQRWIYSVPKLKSCYSIVQISDD